MINLSKKLKKKVNDAGVTLVELICAMAIMSIVGASVAGIMVVSAKTYARGTADVELQESAQLLANQVNNLVQDGFEAVGTSGQLEIKKYVGTSGKDYKIYLDGTTVKYTEADLNPDGTVNTSTLSAPEPMADNVITFDCDTSDYEANGIVRMYIRIEKDSRSFVGNFSATSRNLQALTTVRVGELTMTYTPEYILEPNQDYSSLYAVMSDGSKIEWSIAETDVDSETILSDLPDGKHTIHIGKNESHEKITLILSSEKKRDDGITPKVQKTATVYIRRINDINVTYKNLKTGRSNKTDVSSGAKYNVVFNPVGFNLDKIADVPDMGYDSYEEGGIVKEGLYRTISPRDVIIEGEVCINGNIYKNNLNNYLNDLSIIQDYRSGTPSVTFTLKNELNNGDYVKFIAKSTHSMGTVIGGNPDGTNKVTNITGAPYGDIIGSFILYKTPFPEGGGRITRGGGDQVVGNIDSLIQIIRSEIPDNNFQSKDLQKTYRYCDIVLDDEGNITSQGPWTNWRGFIFDDVSLKIPNEASLSLDCDKAYLFEIAFTAMDSSHTIQLWPKEENTRDQYVYTEYIPKLGLYYYCDLVGYSNGFEYSADVINNSFNLTLDTSKTVGYALTGTYNEILSQNSDRFVWTIERWDEKTNKWSDTIEYEGFTCDFNKPHVYNIRVNRKGKYRLSLNLKNMPSTYYIPATQSYAYTTKPYVQYAELIDGKDYGKGYFVFTVNKNSDYWNSKYVELNGEIRSASEWFVHDGKWYSKSEYFLVDGEVLKKSDYTEMWLWNDCKAYYSSSVILWTSNLSAANPSYIKYDYRYEDDKFILSSGGTEIVYTRATLSQEPSGPWKNMLCTITGWWG